MDNRNLYKITIEIISKKEDSFEIIRHISEYIANNEFGLLNFDERVNQLNKDEYEEFISMYDGNEKFYKFKKENKRGK